MIKKVFIFYILILSLNTKAQNWTPLDTGIHSFIPYGLIADNARGNLFAFGNKFGVGGINVWRKNKWELWYPNIQFGTYGDEVTFFNNKPTFFKNYYENNDNAKPRTAILQFTDSINLDTLKVLQNQNYASTKCVFNGKLILISTLANRNGSNNLATFDGDTILPIGSITIAYTGLYTACVYKDELYAAGWLDMGNSVRGVMKLTNTGWQTIYQIQGSFASINGMTVYNNRLFIYGEISTLESPSNLCNNIIAYDGQNFDTLMGGVINPYDITDGKIYDVAISNNKLYVTGNFFTAGGIKVRGIACWNDTTWCSVSKDLDSTANFFRIETFNDTIYEVAEFHKINGSNYGWIAKLNNMSLADTCSAPRYLKPTHYNFETLVSLPNPFRDNITVETPTNYILSETKFIITNNLGQVLLTIYPDSFNQLLNLSSLSTSMYFLTVQDNSNKKTIKIIKQ